MLAVRVLGPVDVEVAGVAVDLGGRRQRAVLALLLAARGAVVSVDAMIDQLWRGEPPAKAIASLQAYISNLRRLLEPDRPPRAASKLLISAPPGYAVRLPDEVVDAWRYEHLVREAQRLVAADPLAARSRLDEGGALWRGAAYAEMVDEEWAVPEAERLTELQRIAAELWVDATLRAGTPADAVSAATRLTREHPLREEGWRLLALALWGSGRQADALAALRRARTTLSDELGLDPDPGLVALESAILAQRMEVLHAAVGTTPVREPAPAQSVPVNPIDEANGFVGRAEELALVDEVAARARRTGGIVLITGEAGVGKSSVVVQARERLTAAGWTVAVGRCPETEAAPPAWAWVEVLRGLAAANAPPESGPELDSFLHDGEPPTDAHAATGRFRLHQAVGGWLTQTAATTPLALVLDDLHFADVETLTLLESVARRAADRPVLLMATYRPTEIGPRLEQTLAALARQEPVRVPLAGLDEADVAQLIERMHHGSVDAETLAIIADRTGGNPFYVRESVRLLASEGALVATSEVPEGVRDVLRRRLARLPAAAVAVLRLAAVVGRESDVDVLVNASEVPEDGVLDALDAGVIAGLLAEPAPGRVRFVHALVRDTMYTDLTQLRRGRMHGRVADAIRGVHPGDVTALAHHYARAASASTAAQAVEYGIRAAELAQRRYSYDSAIALLVGALVELERLPLAPVERAEREVDLLGRLLLAQVRAGSVAAARKTRGRAIEVAERIGREDLVAAAFIAWTEPTPWHTRPYGWVDRAAVTTLDRLLARDDLAPDVRCRLLDVLVAELSGEDDPRVGPAAAQARELALALGDPQLDVLTLATLGRYGHHELNVNGRDEVANALITIGRDRELPAYEWYGEYLACTTAGIRSDVAAVRQRVDRGLRLARRYGLTEAGLVNEFSQAALTFVDGDVDEADRRYTDTAERMLQSGSIHEASIQALAWATMRIDLGLAEEAEPLLRQLVAQFGSLCTDALAVALAARGAIEEARSVRTERPAIRHDFFFSIFGTLRGMAVVALGEKDEAPALIDALDSRRAIVAGSSSTAVLMRPVALTLGELCRLAGRDEEAEDYFAEAERVALRWGNERWAASARAARR